MTRLALDDPDQVPLGLLKRLVVVKRDAKEVSLMCDLAGSPYKYVDIHWKLSDRLLDRLGTSNEQITSINAVGTVEVYANQAWPVLKHVKALTLKICQAEGSERRAFTDMIPRIETISASLKVESAVRLAGLKRIEGMLNCEKDVFMPELISVCSVLSSNYSDVVTVDFPNLKKIDGSLLFNPKMSLPSLFGIRGSMIVKNDIARFGLKDASDHIPPRLRLIANAISGPFGPYRPDILSGIGDERFDELYDRFEKEQSDREAAVAGASEQVADEAELDNRHDMGLSL